MRKRLPWPCSNILNFKHSKKVNTFALPFMHDQQPINWVHYSTTTSSFNSYSLYVRTYEWTNVRWDKILFYYFYMCSLQIVMKNLCGCIICTLNMFYQVSTYSREMMRWCDMCVEIPQSYFLSLTLTVAFLVGFQQQKKKLIYYVWMRTKCAMNSILNERIKKDWKNEEYKSGKKWRTWVFFMNEKR